MLGLQALLTGLPGRLGDHVSQQVEPADRGLARPRVSAYGRTTGPASLVEPDRASSVHCAHRRERCRMTDRTDPLDQHRHLVGDQPDVGAGGGQHRQARPLPGSGDEQERRLHLHDGLPDGSAAEAASGAAGQALEPRGDRREVLGVGAVEPARRPDQQPVHGEHEDVVHLRHARREIVQQPAQVGGVIGLFHGVPSCRLGGLGPSARQPLLVRGQACPHLFGRRQCRALVRPARRRLRLHHRQVAFADPSGQLVTGVLDPYPRPARPTAPGGVAAPPSRPGRAPASPDAGPRTAPSPMAPPTPHQPSVERRPAAPVRGGSSGGASSISSEPINTTALTPP